MVTVDCVLTDREVLGRANAAKTNAKGHEKGRIAGFSGVLFRDADLALL